MIILARPSISPYLARSLFELQEPVILSEPCAVPMLPALKILPPEELTLNPKCAYQSLILTSSENALHYLYETIPHDDRILKAQIFKDKALFRKAIKRLYTDFFFLETTVDQLDSVKPEQLQFPLVLKPATGISSIGVYRVESLAQWKDAVSFLKKELALYQQNYASAVVEGQKVIAEAWIQGTEIAIDGYFNSHAEPVILNILEHLFENDADTSDRIYFTHRDLIRRNYDALLGFLKRFGDVFDLKRFPFHLEVRITPQGKIIPIELNPLRFAGLGTTELAEYAYGINVYKAFFQEQRPDWEKILSLPDESIYSFMCADVPSDLFRKPGLKIDDRRFFQEFEEILDYRLLSETETSTFAVIFYRSTSIDENRKKLLTLDFRKFMHD